jgi:hypothetical protein
MNFGACQLGVLQRRTRGETSFPGRAEEGRRVRLYSRPGRKFPCLTHVLKVDSNSLTKFRV